MEKMIRLWHSTGLYHLEPGQGVMIVIGVLLLSLAIKKNFEPLLLIPIGFGGILANIPSAGLAASAVSQAMQFGSPELVAAIQAALNGLSYHEAAPAAQQAARTLAQDANFSDGILYLFYQAGLPTGVFPLLIFMGVGAMTDFGPLLANPKTLLLGAAAQFGIFAALIGALFLLLLAANRMLSAFKISFSFFNACVICWRFSSCADRRWIFLFLDSSFAFSCAIFLF